MSDGVGLIAFMVAGTWFALGPVLAAPVWIESGSVRTAVLLGVGTPVTAPLVYVVVARYAAWAVEAAS